MEDLLLFDRGESEPGAQGRDEESTVHNDKMEAICSKAYL